MRSNRVLQVRTYGDGIENMRLALRSGGEIRDEVFPTPFVKRISYADEHGLFG